MNTAYYRRPEILRRLEPGRGHALIEASAGTGKTYTLEHLVIDILVRGEAKIEEILVVTFTEAATRELRERVRMLIRKLCDQSGDLVPGEDPGAYWKIDDVIRSRLREALFRFDGAQISTIHGFCYRVLSEQAFSGGRLFEQEQADGVELFGFAFREEVRRALVEPTGPGKALRRWIEEGHSLLQLEQLLYRCHREGCPGRCPVTPVFDPESFYEKLNSLPGLDELKEAGRSFFVEKGLYKGFEKIIISLFETVAEFEPAKRLQDVAELINWAGKTIQVNKQGDSRFNHLCRMAEIDGAPGKIIKLCGKLEKVFELAADDTSFFVYGLLPRVQGRLLARKRSLGLIDYDDMLLGVLEVLEGKQGRGLIETLRKRWKFALVDEFQDTDPVQWNIFRRIFVEDTDDHFLYIIGDPKQAIYSFRGADVHTYEQAKKYLTGEHHAKRLPLKYNFRSTKELIEAVNEILTVENIAGQPFFSGLNSYREPVECGNNSRFASENGRPAVPVHLLHLYAKGKKLNTDLVKKGVARFIGEEISRLLDENRGLHTGSLDGKPEPIKLSDIYILTRSAAEGYMIGEVLRRFGIPHAFYKQEGLFQTTQADDVYRLLCAIDMPTDPAARMAAWLTPFFGVPLSELPAWKEAGENHPFTTMLHEWKRLADDQAWSHLFESIFTESGLGRRLVFEGDERALTNYLHLFELLMAQAHAQPVTLGELTRSLKERIDGRKLPEGKEGDIQRLETDRQAVQILTMHKSKGLQAEVIFIAGGFGNPPEGAIKMNIYHRDGRRCLHMGKAFGNIDQAVQQEIDEENQRLIYVALTRAKSRLYLPYFGPVPEGEGDPGSYGYSRLGRLYQELQKQLDRLQELGCLKNKDRYLLRGVDCSKSLPGEDKIDITVEGWPEAGLLALPSSRAMEVENIKRAHRGVLLTSYTRMSRGKTWQAPAADLIDDAARRDEEVAAEVDGGYQGTGSPDFSSPGIDELPGKVVLPPGRETGIMLHALLEVCPAGELKDRSFEHWAGNEKVKQQAGAVLRRHGFTEKYMDEALKLIHGAFKTPLRVASMEGLVTLDLPGGIASGERHLPEMFFSYPIPEGFHPLLKGGGNSPVSVERPPYQALRGFLQGLIDLVFEHEGKIYLLDWKSDCMPAFDRATLDDHVQKNYSLQAKVYSLAIMRLLNIGSAGEYDLRFGGIIYAFIRGIGLDAGGKETRGIWFARPGFNTVAAWESDFVERQKWGGDVIKTGTVSGREDGLGGGKSDSGC